MNQSPWTRADSLSWRRFGLEVFAFAVVAWLTAQSAVMIKRGGEVPALVALDALPSAASAQPVETIAAMPEPVRAAPAPEAPKFEAPAKPVIGQDENVFSPEAGHVRYFDGRPIRPARTIWMTVTAYSPDERSCGKWADGRTATNHSVWTNAMRLVAADTRLLPFGSLVSVPGYADGEVVPVLDRGGAIKGRRLDVLYPTHQIARKWGVRRIPVVVWEYADGKPVKIR